MPVLYPAFSTVILESDFEDFITWNPSDAGTGIAFSNNNYDADNGTVGAGAFPFVRATAGIPVNSGRRYWEYQIQSGGQVIIPGMANAGASNASLLGSVANSLRKTGAGFDHVQTGWPDGASAGTALWSAGGGDVNMYAYDSVAGKVWIGLNGAWLGTSVDPASGANAHVTGIAETVYAACGFQNATSKARLATRRSQFIYAPPVGFISYATRYSGP